MNDFNHFEIISCYSRADAINDGILIPLDEKILNEAGFKYPVAVTSAVWENYISWTEDDNRRQTYQDQEGRLWDVLWMLRNAIKSSQNSPIIKYRLYVIPQDGKSKKPILIELKSMIHAGDNGEPVITIMLPDED